MHDRFGRYRGYKPKKCGECSNFKRYKYRGKTYKKCCIYGESNSEATDWNVSYEACNMFNNPYDGTPIIEVLKCSKRPKEDKPIKGQITFNDVLGR